MDSILQKPVDFEGISNFLCRMLPLGKRAATQDCFGYGCTGASVWVCEFKRLKKGES